jgi:apolipoprotein N-acyltransferase
MKTRTKLSLSLLSGVLFVVSWPVMPVPIALFFAFVPLFLIEKAIPFGKRKGWTFWRYTYLALFIFNLGTTWWVKNATLGGAIFMLVANTALMTIPWSLYRMTRRVLNHPTRPYLAFALYWIGFEYFHLNWQISFPWLTLGNGFSMVPNWVQWYEWTGVFGGTIWILASNILAYKWLAFKSNKHRVYLVLCLAVPILVSQLGFKENKSLKPSETAEIAVLQPNIDPYRDKFSGGSKAKIDQVKGFINQLDSAVTPQTKLVLMPETSIVEYAELNRLNSTRSIRLLMDWLKKHPDIEIIAGANAYERFLTEEPPSLTANLSRDGSYYESYNSVFHITADGVKDVYHKAKLVPGVEKLPYPEFFNGLKNLITVDLGGFAGSLAVSTEPKNFETSIGKISPLICYESIYGDYVASFVRRDADIIAVVTNDGWWSNTPGYKQHLNYARLRAIEFRKHVIRSANTGISCLIHPDGSIVTQTEWWQPDVLMIESGALKKETLYSVHGDALGRLGSFLAGFFVLSIIVKSITKTNAAI